jgi:hypothetical protein
MELADFKKAVRDAYGSNVKSFIVAYNSDTCSFMWNKSIPNISGINTHHKLQKSIIPNCISIVNSVTFIRLANDIRSYNVSSLRLE